MTQPILRFPEFKGNWKEIRLGNIAEFLKGKGISKSDVDIKGKLECIRYGELYTHYGEVISKIKSATNINAENVVLSKPDDVIIPASGESAIDIATASCVKRAGIALGGDINVIRSKIDGTFLAYYLNNTRKQDVARFAQGISVIHLYSAQLKLLKINVPPTDDEPSKLGIFFSTIDQKISLLKEKHTLLEQYKKGAMQKLFSQEIRFKDENGYDFPDWKVESIGKYLEEYRERVTVDTEIPVLTSSRTGLYLQKRKIINEGEYGVVPKDYFTYRHMSDDLTFKFNLNREWDKGAVSKEYPVFKTVGMNSYFLETCLNEGNDFKRFAIQQKVGGTRTRLYYKNLVKLKLNTPSLGEQNKIADFLQTLDKKIKLVEQQVKQTQTFKKGLLQQMFV
jgi:type I restriction enzyme S subunit